jgi:large subunit ribosomal protein L35
MPKIKTHKSTSKRFRVTGSGKLMRTRLGKSHLRRKKSKRAKAELPQMHEVELKSQVKRIKSLAPYLSDK